MDSGAVARRARRGPGDAGFSLIEALFAILVLVVAVGGLLRGIAQASRARQAAAETGLATRMARNRMEELFAAPFSRGWPGSGYHRAVAPGGSVAVEGDGSPGYFEYFGGNGEPSDRRSARYEVRWRIRELTPPGKSRLASLRLEVVALPVSGGRGSVVRLEAVRVASHE
jgi:type II secretory pathway pseudopilin PulG